MTTNWNFADVYAAVAARVPDRPCQIHGDRVVTWREFDARAEALAADLVAAGLGHQSKVACYLYNGVEYMEAMVAAFKAAMVPVNTNYRYGPEEIFYLFDNADAEAVVFHATFTELLEGIRDRLPSVKRWYVVADDSGPGRSGRRRTRTSSTSGATLELTDVVPRRRRPAAALHRRHDRHAEGRDVAPGRPVQRARRRRQPVPRHRPGGGRRRGRRRARPAARRRR